MTDFEHWIADMVSERYGTAGRLATLIGMTDSGFSRGLSRGTLAVEQLLRLALETGESVDRVLRLAGKVAVADTLRELYGAEAARLTSKEQRLVTAYRALPAKAQHHLLGMAEEHPHRAAVPAVPPDRTS